MKACRSNQPIKVVQTKKVKEGIMAKSTNLNSQKD
jgi:hypothetical protein